jgi:hypothetical protein
MRRRLATLVTALVISVALAGCGGIPMSGSVKAGGAISDDVEVDPDFAPQGPRTGASQEDILSDFIAAATDPSSDYSVAREFLASTFAEDWEPDANTTIRSGQGTARRVSETEIDYALVTAASVGPDGRYTEGERASATLAFSFVKERDEWRINSAPPGIVLADDSFDNVFGEFALYFFDPTYRYLVPDVRWFPKRSSTSIRVVEALLGGQSSWLSNGALVTAFPAGTALGDGLVDVTSGVATVDLTEEARSASATERDRMRQQLSASIGTVASVVITIGGLPVTAPDTNTTASIANPQVEAAPLILREGAFGFGTAAETTPIPDLSDRVEALSPTAVALARGKQSAAVLAAGGVYSVSTDSESPVLVDSRGGLVAPSIDEAGLIWSAQQSSAASLRVFEPDGTAHDLATTLPADARVASIAVSRDGSRVLFYLTTSVSTQLVVYGIIRQDTIPVALGEPFPLPTDDGAAIGAAWLDNRTVATLSTATGSPDETVVTAVEIGGPTTVLGQLEGGRVVAGGNDGTTGLRVLTADGAIYRPRGTSWQRTGIDATLLATQQ